jgi:hypothetical protein
MTRQTYFERRWPDTPMFQDIAAQWCAEQSRQLLGLVWRGYDLLFGHDLHKVPFAANDEAREESLNFLLAMRIDQCKGNAPFYVAHQPPEQTERKRGKGRSPQPDIGFALYEYPRAVWAMEGKVLMHDRDVSAYLAEIDMNFVRARYATFSSEGAMLGYLVSGDAKQALTNISVELGAPLRAHPSFAVRPHRLSDHKRASPLHPRSAGYFLCHHLILSLVGMDKAEPTPSGSAT